MSLEEKVKKIEEDLQNLRENFDGAVYEDLGDGYQTNRIHVLKKKVEEIFKTIHGIEPSEVDTVKQEIAKLQKEVKNKYNQLLWIKMIPYREWFWNLKNTTDKQINSLKDDYKNLEERYRESGGLRCTRDRGLIKEVLWEIKNRLLYYRLLPSNFDEVYKLDKDKDGEKDENSKDMISSKENNLSAPERRIDGDSKPQTWRGEVPLVYANEKKGDFDRGKDGEKEVEEMSNKNLCREESNIDILPPSKPSRIICKEGVCTYGEPVEYCERYNCKCYNYEKLHEIPKEPTSLKCEKCGFLISNINKYGAFYCWELDMKMFALPLECIHFQLKEPTEKEDHEFDYDYNCVKCGKNLLELVDRTYLTIEFDTHDTHKIVLNAGLKWLFWMIQRPINEVPQIGDTDECYKELEKLDKMKEKYLEDADE